MNGVVATVNKAIVGFTINIIMIVPINNAPWEIISKIALFKALKILSKSELNRDNSFPSWWVSK